MEGQVKTSSRDDGNKKRRILLILLLLLFIIIGLIFSIQKVLGIGAPIINASTESWSRSVLVSVSKDARTFKKITYYEYCISADEGTSDCEWKRTYTKNIEVSTPGEWYVRFRAVTEDGEVGEMSSPQLVKVDNVGPKINRIDRIEITENGTKIQVFATDLGIGNIKYLYSLDGKTYVEAGDTFFLEGIGQDSKQRIYIKVIDELGNETIFSAEVDTIGKEGFLPVPDTSDGPAPNATPRPRDNTPARHDDSEKDKEKSDDGGESSDGGEDSGDDSGDEGGDEGGDDGGDEGGDDPVDPPVPPEPEYDTPSISLDEVPASFTYEEEYTLPSSYDFGNDTGTVKCKIGSKEYTNTKQITTGTHLIECTAESAHGKTVSVSKQIEVNYTRGMNEELDGWIKLNLYYPENSTNWEWRMGKEDTVRTGYNEDGWQPYTGPILVKIDDIDKIFIRYKMGENVYIVAPKGKITVDIEPSGWTLHKDEVTRVKITYDNTATTKEYRINKGEWTAYTDSIVVGPNTLIEARASKEENVYNSAGEFQYINTITATDSAYISLYAEDDVTPPSPDDPVGPKMPVERRTFPGPDGPVDIYVPPENYPTPTALEGPAITANPTTITDETTISITTQEEARKIYYNINNGSWSEYTAPFKIDYNSTIRAYYIKKDDGRTSKTSTYYVDNIKVPGKPYVRISTSPSRYLTDTVESVEISISGSDYDTLEYSLDGNIYKEYTGPFTVHESVTVYAKGTNSNGQTIESVTITTKNPPVQKQNLDIYISTNPDKKDVVGLINKATVTIDYDPRATKKYYKLSSIDSWKEYTGSFKITSNATIYAYCTSENGRGEAEYSVGFLTTGINSPSITFDSTEPASEVKVSISYHKNASIKQYKIGNGEWQDYTEPFYVDENTTVYAYNSDILGNEAESSKAITGIVSAPNYTPLDMGTYYTIKLNYPNTADPNDREYKWKKNGAWKQYDEKGILLIKAEYKDQYDLSGDGVVVKDKDGNDVIFKDHYYLLDVPASELSENLYMRWSNDKPEAPIITIDNTTTPTNEVNVAISYAESLIDRYYKYISEDGIDTGWVEYTGAFKVEQNGVIYAKGRNAIEIESKVASTKIKNIDEISPTIDLIADLDTPKQQVSVTVNATDNLEIDAVKYAKGEQETEYFKTDGIVIENNSVVMVKENGIYTFYAKDMVGHEVIKTIEVTNIDINAPEISIINKTPGYGIRATIEIDYGDSSIKQYSIGNTSNYRNYEDEFTINSNDYYQLANADGSLTVYAKGTDSAGNTVVVSEKIYNLDLDMPEAPVINNHIAYPVLTTTGFTVSNLITISYDDRDDIVNYVDANDGDNYRIYEGPTNIIPGTIKAKSTKKNTGLTREISQNVDYPSDSITPVAFDGDSDSSVSISANNKRIFNVNTNNNTIEIFVKSNAATGGKIKTYHNDSLTNEFNISSANTKVRLSSNTTKVEIVAGSAALTVSEIEIAGVVKTIEGDSITSIVQENEFETGYYVFKVADEEYSVHMYNYNESQTAVENTQFGDAGDVATANSYAENMVIVKVNGDLTINSGVTVGPYYNNYGGPKGFMLYVTGKLTNNGTIDNSHGAKAAGQDVYLWKNALTNDYEMIDSAGGAGVAGNRCYAGGCAGATGGAGSTKGKRDLGGGGTGVANGSNSWTYGYSGSSAAGTSYSGGTGSGAGVGGEVHGGNGAANGGAGGTGVGGGSGVGNPAGGTGGLLVIYSNEYKNNGTIKASGTAPASTTYGGGSSGGGSINIFTNQPTGIDKLGVVTDTRYNEIKGTTNAAGGAAVGTTVKGGAGGAGTVNIGEIRNGQYYDLKEIINQDIATYTESVTVRGDSLLSIMENNDLEEGYYYFVANSVPYPVHLYVLEGDQTFTSNKSFGDLSDCATGTSTDKMAQNMVIVKVKGDLTVNEGVTVGPTYNTTYGGPKGFMLYVTGKLTNNGTIDNSHGAKAAGQDVYLWKNALTNDYEMIDSAGGAGAAGKGCYASGCAGTAGGAGSTKGKRDLGGGGTGVAKGDNNWTNGYSGSSTAATSYSGGTGSGAGIGNNVHGGDGVANGGAGGSAGGSGGAGVGNPSGGTGGLLVIYSNEYENNGNIKASGTSAASNANGGGSSGGGSINIFTNQSVGIDQLGVITDAKYNEMKGATNAAGGAAVGTTTKGGAGGAGTVNIGEIRDGQYYDLKEIIDQDKIAYEESVTLEGDSIISILDNNSGLASGYYLLKANGESYSVHTYVLDGNQTFAEDKTFGNENDVATASTNAQNMVIVKVNGDLTINSGVTVGPYYNNYGGPKGFLLYVTGKLTNNGTIDNSHGAKAVGQNVYLWKNAKTDDYELVGSVGGAGVSGRGCYASGCAGSTGGAGSTTGKRNLGGGGTGVAKGYNSWTNSYSGASAAGTSYSGGAGSGAGVGISGEVRGGNGAANGGAGGAGAGSGGSGVGNPAGGTGGLLIVYSNEYENNGTIKASGTAAASNANGGGSSGGGSINIFTNQATYIDDITIAINAKYDEMKGATNAAGGAAVGTTTKGGAGGAGTVNIGEIRDGQYYDLKDVIIQDIDSLVAGTSVSGESLLDIVADSSITSGYYTATVNNESYRAHVYTLDGNQTFTSNMTFGDKYDAGDDSTNAKEMVIVKVNGDLTINSGVTVGPYYSDYGGPKGFMLYVTGTLTNNGTIDNSHGAKAKGQNVYLYKNADDSYEYVPAEGGIGADKRTGSTTNSTVVFAGYSGYASDIARGTGGGASGGLYINYNQPETGVSGAGSRGTSYSGGSGGGMVASVWGANVSAFDAAGDGGAGGAAKASYNSNYRAIGGTGNPGGAGSVGTSGAGSSTSASYKGQNGTGGLLIVYAYSVVNNGKIQANGTNANSVVNANVSTAVFGGPSGGGSINIFYDSGFSSNGTIQANGGATVANGATGGAGSISIGSIATGTYQGQ